MDKPTCPYCGHEMAHHLGMLNEQKGGYDGYSECPECKARGPRVFIKTGALCMTERNLRTAEHAILNAARCRYIKPARPMLLKDAAMLDLVYVEMKTESGQIQPVAAVYADNHTHCKLWRIATERPYYFKIAQYGKTWRCWERVPTEEERKAAAWEV